MNEESIPNPDYETASHAVWFVCIESNPFDIEASNSFNIQGPGTQAS